MITSRTVSKVSGAVLLSASIVVLFSAVAWLFWRDMPTLIIALGVWIISVALIWIMLWRATDRWRIHSRPDVRRRVAVRALPLALSFAPTFVALGPMIAFPLPASLALPLLVANALLETEQLWALYWQISLAATSLFTVWLVCFFVMCRTGSRQVTSHEQESSRSGPRIRFRLKPPRTEQSTYEY